MKRILCLLALIVAVVAVKADEKKPSFIQWKDYDCSSPLLLPANHFDVSQFGKGTFASPQTASINNRIARASQSI